MIEMITSDRVLKRWLFKAVIGALIGLFALHQRHAISNQFMQIRLDAVSHFQQRMAQPPAPAPAPVRSPEQVEAERAAAKVRADEYAANQAQLIQDRQQAERKELAWQSFFRQERSCMLPESQVRIEVCRAREHRLRQQFDRHWAQSSVGLQ